MVIGRVVVFDGLTRRGGDGRGGHGRGGDGGNSGDETDKSLSRSCSFLRVPE